MSEANSTPVGCAGKTQKPNKPYPDFPLFAHAAGVWAKKIRGKLHYFAPWADPDGALAKYNQQKDALHAGRKPREEAGGVTVKELANQFLAAKRSLVGSGELTQRSWDDYKAACDLLVQHFGKSRLVADLDPEDFAHLREAMVKKKWGPTTLGNVVQRTRVVFKYAFDNGILDRPVRYGQNYKRPSRKTVRIDRARKGPKLFTAQEVRTLLDGALVVGDTGPELVRPGPIIRAMVLLGINCGYGNSDCGHLRRSNVDIDAGVIDYPRPKTGIQRRCVLWPETIAALHEALTVRPAPKDEAHRDLVFVTKYGLPWAKDSADHTLAKEFARVLRALGIGRQGQGYYTLRHTFRTVADEARDQPAADYIMGHESPHMSSHYRETISDERLRGVTDYVRRWVFGEERREAGT